MTSVQSQGKLVELMALPAETEWVEFKEAKNNNDFDDLGRYFSALSNEANLKGQACGWLVFGVSNKPPRQIVGSNYRHQHPGLERLKSEIAQHTNHQITFQDIHEVTTPQGRVVLFQIPPAPRGIPREWKGRVYGRHDEAISPLTLQEIEEIRDQARRDDWSAQIAKEPRYAISTRRLSPLPVRSTRRSTPA
jgi:ATP-dependent DNA helicase RecG